MLRKIRGLRRWPLWRGLTIVGSAQAMACIFQIPFERQVPGEPFLLFLLVAIGATLAFGARVGLAGVGLSTLFSLLFFEPHYTLAISHAADLVKVQLYATLASGCVLAVAYFGNALIAASEESEALMRKDANKSILLRELAHGVANNFATVVALLSMKSAAVSDAEARSVLDETIDQIAVIGRVHRRLRAGDQDASLDGAAFFHELCADLKTMMRGRPLSLECSADSHRIGRDQAVGLGLIVHELVTNAVKHAFPGGRAGNVRVEFEALSDQLRLTVEDDGIGSGWSGPPNALSGTGSQGQYLIRGLLEQLDGKLEAASTSHGTSFRISIPDAGLAMLPAGVSVH
jgi:two-component system, sensor histidine kinase PdtaS